MNDHLKALNRRVFDVALSTTNPAAGGCLERDAVTTGAVVCTNARMDRFRVSPS